MTDQTNKSVVFAESSLTEDDVGTGLTECNLTNVDTSTVGNMSSMFYQAESFDQDVDAWDTRPILAVSEC